MIVLNCHNNTIRILLFYMLLDTLSGAELSCKITTLFGCGPHEQCIQTSPGNETGLCQCLSGFERVAGSCEAVPEPHPETTPASRVVPPTAEPHTDSSSKNAVVAGVLVPLLLLAGLLAGLVYLGRRFHWLHRLRQLRPLQRTNDVLIGRPDDDDDPIA